MEPEDDEIEGELVEMDEGVQPEIMDTADGGALIVIGDDDEEDDDGEFYRNLAETLPDSELAEISSSLLELIEIDKNARSKRDELYAEGLRRTGLSDEAPGGAAFVGASKTVHPMLVEGCVDFSSRVMKELFPRGGPVKDYIPGRITEEKIAKAQRKTNLMNWQLTKQCKEFRAELEQLVTQVPLGGDQYLKVTWLEDRNRPEFLFVGVDEMYLPFAATNFYTAQRKTHVQYLTRVDFERRVKSGMYRDVDAGMAGMDPDMSEATKANNPIEGREETNYNEDGLRTVFEVFTIADIEDEGAAPYIISIDKTSMKVLAVYRNWSPEDEAKEELQHFVQYPFIPWRGAYSIGLTHMIGGLSGSATGALRALLDSAHIQNAPSALKLKGGKIGGQTRTPQPGEVLEIEGGFAADDIRKIAMPMPFNGPSQTLFQLLEFIVQAGKGVVRTALDDLPDMQADVPVGTTLARIEQGLVVFSAIHGRMHDAMGRLLDILHRLNARHLDDEATAREAGELLATRADFEGAMDVCPVSDPNIFSETQRIAQVQTVSQRADLKPDLYDQRKVEEMVLRTLKVPGAEALLVPAVVPKEQNAVNENVAASLGRPVVAFPEQDHLSHLATHITYMQAPLFGALPIIAPSVLPIMLGHIREHVAMWYAHEVFKTVSDSLGRDLGDFMREMNEDGDSREKQTLDKLLAEANLSALEAGQQTLSAIPQVIQQAQQMLAQMQQPAPPDPFVELERKKIEDKTQIEMAKLQQDAQSDGARLQIEQQQDAADRAFDQQKLAVEQQDSAADRAADVGMNDADNAMAMQLALLGAARTSTNPNPNPRP